MTSRIATAALITRQDGLITIEQARRLGLTDHAIRGLRDRGEWRVVLPGVLRPVESIVTTKSRIRAVSLWAGDRACIDGQAAAYWWGMRSDLPSAVRVVIPKDRRLRPAAGVDVSRRMLPAPDRVRLRGIVVTGRALTALDAAIDPDGGGPTVLDRALQTGLSLDAVRSAHYRSLGRHGSAAAARLIAAAADGAGAISERLFVKLLRRAGIRGWRLNLPVSVGRRTYVLDAAFLCERIAVEIDGWAWHHTPDRFQGDRVRQNALINAGWRVLRFTWFDLVERPEYVLAQVRQALRRSA